MAFWRVSSQAVDTDGMESDVLLVRDATIPANQTALGTKATTSDWDANTELSITANSWFLHISSDEDMHFICDSATGDPSTDGAIYYKLQTHRIPCRGQTKLHYKCVTAAATGNIYVTAFHD